MSLSSLGSASWALSNESSSFAIDCVDKFGLQTLQDNAARKISVGSHLFIDVVTKTWREGRATGQIGQVRQQQQQQSPAAADNTTAAAPAAAHAMPWHAHAPHSHPVLLWHLPAVACTSSQPRSAVVCCSLTPAASCCLLLQCIAEIRIARKPFGSYGDVSAPAFVQRLPNGDVLFFYAHAGQDYGREFEVRRLSAPERPPTSQSVFVVSL